MNANPNRNPSSSPPGVGAPSRRATPNRNRPSAARNPPDGSASSSPAARNTAHRTAAGDTGPRTSNTNGPGPLRTTPRPPPPSNHEYSSRPNPRNVSRPARVDTARTHRAVTSSSSDTSAGARTRRGPTRTPAASSSKPDESSPTPVAAIGH